MALVERSLAQPSELVNQITAGEILKTKNTEIYTGVYGKRRMMAIIQLRPNLYVALGVGL